MMIIYSENKTGFTSTHEKVDSCSETGMSNGYSVIFFGEKGKSNKIHILQNYRKKKVFHMRFTTSFKLPKIPVWNLLCYV